MTQEWTVHKVDEVLDLIEELTKKVKGVADHVREMQKTLDSITESQNEYNNPYLTPELLEAARKGAREQEHRKDDPLLALIDKVKAEDLSTFNGSYEYAQGWRDALMELESQLPDPPMEN